MAAKRRPKGNVSLALQHRGMVHRMVEICVEMRPLSPADVAEVCKLMDEFSTLAWQLGYPIRPPDDELQALMDEHGWLLKPHAPDPPEDPC